MSFFAPLPPPEDDEYAEPARRDWHGPPPSVLGGMVARQLVLGRTDDMFLGATHFELYPTGLRFDVVTRVREGTAGDSHRLFDPWAHDAMDPNTGLRLGVLYPDGRRANGHRFGFLGDGEADPQFPVLSPLSGAGGDSEFRAGHWLWPAPPPGDLVLVAMWTDRGIPETRATISAELMADARTRITEIWPAADA